MESSLYNRGLGNGSKTGRSTNIENQKLTKEIRNNSQSRQLGITVNLLLVMLN